MATQKDAVLSGPGSMLFWSMRFWSVPCWSMLFWDVLAPTSASNAALLPRIHAVSPGW